MGKVAKRATGMAIVEQNAMLKHSDPEDFKKIFAGYILKCYRLNGQPEPDPAAFNEIVTDLFELLQTTWPGAKMDQIWLTLKNGMTKQGDRYLLIKYPTVANWLTYHRVLKAPENYPAVKVPTPNLNEQAQSVLKGLAEYRKRVESGEYKPKGRES